MYRNILITLLLLLLLTSFSFAQSQTQNGSELKVEIVVNGENGWPTKLIVSGTNPQDKAWLGISLYPYAVIDPITGGRHSSIELKKGEFRNEIQIDTNLLGGSYEFALWGKKVDKVDCTIDNCYWCKKNGFHFDDMLAYKSGYLSRLTGYK